jgi:superfamily II DNA or RNA helicase
VILRPRQQIFVDRCLRALSDHGQTLAVAPTGAGKTVAFCAVGREHGGRTLVLQHREELVRQNRATWQAINPDDDTDAYCGWRQRWGNTTFAMQPTLARANHLDGMPAVDLVIVDEAHHAVAPTYLRILDRARELNPDVHVLGVTATPNRGDKTSLVGVFDNVADQITIGELIQAGHLVRPRAYVVDVGVNEELTLMRKLRSGEYDLQQAAAILKPTTSQVVEHWLAQASDRKTVVFTGTCEHAGLVVATFQRAGVEAACVFGSTPKAARAHTFDRLEKGALRVLVNVAVATEGWDCPPVSCVVLLRPSSYHSTMTQMIGRGLRVIDPERYPRRVKTDCLVLDFGRSLLTHGGIEQLVELDPKRAGVDAPKKRCPKCEADVLLGTRECPLCSYQWPPQLAQDAPVDPREFELVELDLMIGASPFRWVRYNDRCRVVTAFQTWAVAFEMGGHWRAFGGHDGETRQLAIGSERVAVGAGDDWMRLHGDRRAGGKNARWLELPPSVKQQAILDRFTTAPPVTNRYEAACALTLRFNRDRIRRALEAS